MFPFSQSVTPAVRTHVDAQMSFINDMSKSLFRSFQQMCDLNIQLAQTMLEETTLASQQLITAERPPEVLSAAAARAQPATEKLRAYQQHLARVAADAQVELARVTEQHVEQTARTARALADEVARAAGEEAERTMRTQQESIRSFSDPFSQAASAGGGQDQPRRSGNGAAGASTSGAGASMAGQSMQGAGQSMQSAGQGSQGGGSQGTGSQRDLHGGAGSMQSGSAGGAGGQSSQGPMSSGSSATSGAKSGGGHKDA